MSDETIPSIARTGEGEPQQTTPYVSVSQTGEAASVASDWTEAKSSKSDLTDAEKTAFEAARDSTKQLLSLATGVIALTITFSKDYIGSGVPGRWLALSSWGLFLLSAFFGLWTLNALTGNAGAVRPKSWLSIRSPNVTIPAGMQVLTFLLGLVMTVSYAGSATISASNVRGVAFDDSLRLSTMSALIQERLFWSLDERIAQLGGSLDTSAVAVLRRVSSTAALRLVQQPSPSPRTDSIVRVAIDSLAGLAVKSSGRDTGRRSIGIGAVPVLAVRKTVDARSLSSVWAFCPIYPFC